MWTAIVHVITGLWLMAMPDVLGSGGRLADSNHIAGPVIVTFGLIAIWDINKCFLKVNFLVSAWLIFAPVVVQHTTTEIILNITAGIVLIATALVKRKDKYNYGGGWISLFQKHPQHIQSTKNTYGGDEHSNT